MSFASNSNNVTSQPQPSNILIINNHQPSSNNVWKFENNWHTDFCDCCEDLSQCI